MEARSGEDACCDLLTGVGKNESPNFYLCGELNWFLPHILLAADHCWRGTQTDLWSITLPTLLVIHLILLLRTRADVVPWMDWTNPGHPRFDRRFPDEVRRAKNLNVPLSPLATAAV